MASQSAKQVVEEMIRHFNTHDLDAVYTLLADDYRQYLSSAIQVAGRDAARQADSALYEAVSDYRRETVALLAEGNSVSLEWRLLGTSQTGTPVNVALVSLMRIADGKIAEGSLYFDAASLAAAIH